MNSRHLVFACCALAFSTPALAITVIVGDGGNLGAAIAAANNQDIIEIQSNGTFSGSLTWSNKYLTIRAGNGFHPTIQGSISGIYGSNPVTGGTFQGLNVTGSLNATATATTYANYLVEHCTLQGGSTLSGTGSFQVNATFNDTDVPGVINFGGTGGFTLDVTVNHSVLHNDVYLNTLANENVLTAHFNDNDIYLRPHSGGGSQATDHRNLSFARNRFRQGIDLSVGNFNNFTVKMTDNVLGDPVIPPAINDAGLLLRSFYSDGYAANVNASFVNNTVVGFGHGVQMSGFSQTSNLNVDFANMLLRNTDDLLDVPASRISYSLISDGTYNNQNNNFFGIPLLGSDGALLPGSPGIDRGNNSKASTSDFLGHTRILDGNSDGIKVVDVGAYEVVVPEPATFALTWLALAACALSRRSER